MRRVIIGFVVFLIALIIFVVVMLRYDPNGLAMIAGYPFRLIADAERKSELKKLNPKAMLDSEQNKIDQKKVRAIFKAKDTVRLQLHKEYNPFPELAGYKIEFAEIGPAKNKFFSFWAKPTKCRSTVLVGCRAKGRWYIQKLGTHIKGGCGEENLVFDHFADALLLRGYNSQNFWTTGRIFRELQFADDDWSSEEKREGRLSKFGNTCKFIPEYLEHLAEQK